MGDISAEPSMEDILSSIKRIIAEDGETALATGRAKKAARTAASAQANGHVADIVEGDGVLELSEAMEPARPPKPVRRHDPAPAASEDASSEDASSDDASSDDASSDDRAEAIVSAGAAEAVRGPLEALSRLVVTPDTPGRDTLEGLVRELLRPMLREWLDAKLPGMVEGMVAREIARITGRGL